MLHSAVHSSNVGYELPVQGEPANCFLQPAPVQQYVYVGVPLPPPEVPPEPPDEPPEFVPDPEDVPVPEVDPVFTIN